MICYAAGIVLGAAASRNTNTNLAAAITNIVSGLVPVLVTIPLFTKKTFTNQRLGILLAVACGIMIAAFVMAVNKAYAENKVGIVAPAVFGGAIFLSTVLSYFVFKEKVSSLQLLGLLLLAIGFGIVLFARATGR